MGPRLPGFGPSRGGDRAGARHRSGRAGLRARRHQGPHRQSRHPNRRRAWRCGGMHGYRHAAANVHSFCRLRQQRIATLSLANTFLVRAQLAHAAGRFPATRESADHSCKYLLAMALLEGDVNFDQFDRARWLDDGVKSLMSRIEVEIDPAPPCRSPCALSKSLTLSEERE